MVSFQAPSGGLNYEIKQFASGVEKKSNGAVKFTIYEASLGAPPDHWDMAKKGMVQFALTANAFHSARLSVLNMTDLPFEFPDAKSCKLVLEAWQKADYVKELSDNFKIVWLNPTSPLLPSFAKKKVEKLEDWKGLKIRAPSALQSQAIAAMGASAVSMPGGEVYMAMSTGVIDGYVTAPIGIIGWKYYEVTDYTMENPLCFGQFLFVMNKDTWNNVPSDLQTIIDQVGKEVADAEVVKIMTGLPDTWKEIRSKGIDVYSINDDEMEKWRALTKGIAEEYVKSKEGSGYPVKEAYNLMKKTVADYNKK
jgi:TRAP-type C4-dicarboxylate transport system substrate-binding protein